MLVFIICSSQTTIEQIEIPEGISSSMRDFIVLVFNIEVFSNKVFLKIKSLKKKKKS